MRGRKILVVALLAAATALPQAAEAQLSPRGILGAVTRPFRDMLGHFGNYPRSHHSRGAQDRRTAAAEPEPFANPSGPAAWPAAFVDVLGYALWPDDYAKNVRGHGFDVIATAIVAAPHRSGPGVTTGSAAGTAAAASSDSKDNSEGAWLAGRVEQTVSLTGTQHQSLDKLKAAVDQAMSGLRFGCNETAAAAPADRLSALTQQLWTLRDSAVAVRAPLKAFYDSLTDEQKAKFEVKPPDQKTAKTASTAVNMAPNTDMKRQYQACAGPGLQASERMLKGIEQDTRPAQQQAPSLDALRKTTTDMAKLLTASCTKPIPADPLARLDDATDQLSSMSYAATSVQIALDAFRAQLDGAQKTKFDSLGE